MKNDPRSCERNLCTCVRSLKKIQDFDGIWTPDLAIPVKRSNKLSYEATDVGGWSIMCSYIAFTTSFDSISVVLIILYNLFYTHSSHKNNGRTNSKENPSRLLMTLKIRVDGQDDKNNEHNGIKNICFLFFSLLWPLGFTAHNC